jgi:hypothetical protein
MINAFGDPDTFMFFLISSYFAINLAIVLTSGEKKNEMQNL